MFASSPQTASSLAGSQEQQLAERIKALSKPGTHFSEPVSNGPYTVITAVERKVKKDRYVERPVAVIILGPEGVKVRPVVHPVRALGLLTILLSIIVWAPAVILHPPWRPEADLIPQVEKLIETIRRK